MSGPITTAISAAVRAARESAGATREGVAAAARAVGAPDAFTAAAMRNIESGRRPTSVDEVVWLAAALDVAPRQLLGEHADLFARPAAAPTVGSVEESTRRSVEELGDLAGHHQALAELAYMMARSLDRGEVQSPAPVARELRATLAVIWDGRGDGEEDDDFGPE